MFSAVDMASQTTISSHEIETNRPKFVRNGSSGITRDLLAHVIARAGSDRPPAMLGASSHVNRSLATSVFYDQSSTSFASFLLATHRRSRQTRFLIFALIASTYIWRSPRDTWPAAIVVNFAQLAISASIGWLVLGHLRPEATERRRSSVETIISAASAITMLTLPPLSYKGLAVPKNSISAALAILRTSRAVHGIFQMGSSTLHGFVYDLQVLTAILFLSLHWNRSDCELLCGSQTGLPPHFLNLRQALLPWLGPKYLAVHPIDVCIQTRIFLQLTLGFIVPIYLGYRREKKDHKAFNLKYNLPQQDSNWKLFLHKFLLCLGVCVIVVGILSQILMAIPELGSLPSILVGIGPSIAEPQGVCQVP
eukprot:jgi/Botrbrau1/6668/Bobra.0202s0016.1